MQQLNFCLVPWHLQQGQLNKTLSVHYLYSGSFPGLTEVKRLGRKPRRVSFWLTADWSSEITGCVHLLCKLLFCISAFFENEAKPQMSITLACCACEENLTHRAVSEGVVPLLFLSQSREVRIFPVPFWALLAFSSPWWFSTPQLQLSC